MTASLRHDYLAAIGLEPLVLRTDSTRRDPADAATARDAAARLLDAHGDQASHGANESSVHAHGQGASRSASSTPEHALGSRAPRPDVQADAGVTSRPGVAADTADGLFAPRPARLHLATPDAEDFAGPHAALLRALVRALGVTESDVRFAPHPALQDDPAGAAGDALPILAFGVPSDTAALQAQALAQLRDAAAKRALWPVLRRLRRTLRHAHP